MSSFIILCDNSFSGQNINTIYLRQGLKETRGKVLKMTSLTNLKILKYLITP